MAIDTEKIKEAFGKFEADDFESAKQIIAQEIRDKRNDYYKQTLDLEKDL